MDRGPIRHRRLRCALFASILAAFALLVSAAAAEASTIVVNTTADTAPTANECSGTPGATDCSLRQAVDKAMPDDIIQLPAGQYSLTLGADIEIAKSLTIEGDTASDTTIDGSENNAGDSMATARILRVDNVPVTIQDLTLTGGLDGADETCPSGCSVLAASGGGALFNDGGDVTLDDVAFTGNISSGPLGGAVSTASGTLNMTNVSFTHDSSGVAGALFVRGGTVTGNGVTFQDDSTTCCEGGAAYLYGGNVTFTNTTIVNSAGLDGTPAIANGGAALTLRNDTLSDNPSDLQTDTNATTTTENTILGTGGFGPACEPAGREDETNGGTTGPAITTDGGHNIDQDTSCGLTAASDFSNVAPRLGSIADNGGPTRTEALLHGSPALGAANEANCPATDQRGVTRANPCDIGAFEAEFLGQPSATTEPAQNIQQDQADLGAQVNFDGEAGGLRFLWGTSRTALTNSTVEVGLGVQSQSTPETETLAGLNPATTYYYEAVADNASGSATGAVESFTTTAGPPVISNVNVASFTDTTATIGFSVDPQGSDTSYYVEYGPDANYGQQTQSVHIGSTPGAQDLSATLSGLSPGTDYHFQVIASYGAQQSVDGGDDRFTTAQQVTGVVGGQVTVTDSGTIDEDCPSAQNTNVDWGDDSSDTNAQIQCQPGFEDETDFTLTDTHTYNSPGHYLIQISYGDLDGITDEYAQISPSSPPPSSPPPGSPAASNPSAPAIATTAPTVSITSAGFSGSVTPNGVPTQAYFQYGLDPKYTGGGPLVYGQSTPAQSVGSDFANHTIGPVAVSGLLPNALYHARLVATNSAGTTYGPDQTFTTEAAPAPSAPTLGKTVNVSPVSGFVLIKINGKFVPLTGLEQIPFGAEIDARHGSLELITSTGQERKTQHGVFGGAIFKLTQSTEGKGKGLVTLAIVEAAFNGAPSYATCKAPHKAGDPSAAAASVKTLQLLHASAHGKFRTEGKYSAATVLGTKWTIADRCDGTLVHDITDSVAVTDFVRHKTIVLHAGQSYLAKAPGRH